jgi:NitT/TauT family transport system substrate-binding protein
VSRGGNHNLACLEMKRAVVHFVVIASIIYNPCVITVIKMQGISRKRDGAIVAWAFGGLTLVLSLLWSSLTGGCSGPVESIRFGTSLLEPCIPVFVAQDRQFFAANGLDVTINYYGNGLDQVDAMLRGEVDMSGPSAEYVLVGKAFQKQRIRAIGNIDQAENAFIVARKDRGIESVADLKGKKIGLVRGTIVEFHLGRCLELHGMSIKDITLVDMSTFAQSTDAVIKGDVDACVALVPFTEDAQVKLGDNGEVWPAQSGQSIYALLLCPSDLVDKRPDLVKKFLSAMSQAEDYIIQHPQEARAIARRKLNVASDYMDKIWSRNRFALSLDQSLITAMEDEARWMMGNRLTSESKVPNFLDYIYEDGLKAVTPEAVNVIR